MGQSVNIVLQDNKRLLFGSELISQKLNSFAIANDIVVQKESPFSTENLRKDITIYVGIRGENEFIKELEEDGRLLYHTTPPENEGYYLAYISGENLYLVIGGSATGALYGCLEFADILEKDKNLPRDLAYSDAPVYKLRGPAIGLQLTKVEPPRLTYEYPITPKRFPWFYDRGLWIKFLDQLLDNRCNCLYIWTGQPFSSLVKLKDYPEALEVEEDEYRLNRETFEWLTEECDKRGIWLVLKFYSIHIPLPLAQKYNVELLQSTITDLNRDYTYKSIVEFIKSFPHIGLMVCLGEALRGTNNKKDWFLETIIPAVKEGIKEANLTEEPPLILRGHDCDPNMIMEEAVNLYGNLYTMWKYNGESLTTYLPTGKWQEVHQKLASHGQTHIMNVHVVANLEPFRYAAPGFIQKCVQAGRDRLGTNGMHIYPLFFWDWPYSPDKTSPRLLQMDRDWLWYKMWFRYAWNPDRDRTSENIYWTDVFDEHFMCGKEAAGKILKALSYAGECAPRILRRVGITEGNRQTMSLGMTMSQFTNVKRYRPNYELWHSVSTPGEQPEEYVLKNIKGERHYGETPVDMINDIVYYSEEARKAIEEALVNSRDNAGELKMFATDIEAIYYMVMSYSKKLEAAMSILTYRFTMKEDLRGDLKLLEEAVAPWRESLDWYSKLADLTDRTYLYANSMQTRQRKIPFPDGDAYGHWKNCLLEYEKEFDNYMKHLSEMKAGKYPGDEEDDSEDIEPLMESPFELLSEDCTTYRIEKGQQIFTDMKSSIMTYAKELEGLTGVSFGLGHAINDGAMVKLDLKEDCYVLIAYMNAKGIEWLQLPDLETNTHADDRGGLAVVYANAIQAEGCPDMNIHAYKYEKGIHEIFFGTGGYSVVGVVKADQELRARNAGLSGETLDKLDWLYE